MSTLKSIFMGMSTTWKCSKCNTKVVAQTPPPAQGCTAAQPASGAQAPADPNASVHAGEQFNG